MPSLGLCPTLLAPETSAKATVLCVLCWGCPKISLILRKPRASTSSATACAFKIQTSKRPQMQKKRTLSPLRPFKTVHSSLFCLI